MVDYPDDQNIEAHIVAIRTAMPSWVIAATDLVELAANAERAGSSSNAGTADRSRKLIVEVAEWQEKLQNWQQAKISPRLGSELRILKATLDAAMDEANSAAGRLAPSIERSERGDPAHT